jgi:hypothetical protein
MAKFDDEEIGGIEYGAVKFDYRGLFSDADPMRKRGRLVLGEMKRRMALGEIEYGKHKVKLDDGTVIIAKSIKGFADQDTVHIDTTNLRISGKCIGFIMRDVGENWTQPLQVPDYRIMTPDGITLNWLQGPSADDYKDGAGYPNLGAKWITCTDPDWQMIATTRLDGFNTGQGDIAQYLDTVLNFQTVFDGWFPPPEIGQNFINAPVRHVDNLGMGCYGGGIRFYGSEIVLTAPSVENGWKYWCILPLSQNLAFRFDDDVRAYYPRSYSLGETNVAFTITSSNFGSPTTVSKGVYTVKKNKGSKASQLSILLAVVIDNQTYAVDVRVDAPKIPDSGASYQDVVTIRVDDFNNLSTIVQPVA